MTPTTPYLGDDVEAQIRRATADVTRPRKHECLCCYVVRLLNDFPCDGSHRHSLRYRDMMAPRATALIARLKRVGARCCDCELFANGYWLRSWLQQYAVHGFIQDDHGEAGFARLPVCQGVRRGSVQPCRNWVRLYRP